MTDHSEKISALMKDIAEKSKKRDNILSDLNRSLAIQHLWPDAFKVGSCKSYLAGSIRKPAEMLFTIERKDGIRYGVVIERLPRIILEDALSHVKDLFTQDKKLAIRFWEKHRNGFNNSDKG